MDDPKVDLSKGETTAGSTQSSQSTEKQPDDTLPSTSQLQVRSCAAYLLATAP
jgi:hypothetical protein